MVGSLLNKIPNDAKVSFFPDKGGESPTVPVWLSQRIPYSARLDS